MLAPLAPHFAEECWERLHVGAAAGELAGKGTSVFDASWPKGEADVAREERVELVVQVNGKVRGRLQVARGTSQAAVVERALADEGVKKFVGEKRIRKTVYVEDRLVNLVV